MKPLSKEASAALNALQATDPTSADEARVRAGLEKTLGVAMVATASTQAAAAAATTGAKVAVGLSVTTKVIVAVAVVAVSATTVIALSQPSPQPSPPRGEGARIIHVPPSPRGGEGRGEGLPTPPPEPEPPPTPEPAPPPVALKPRAVPITPATEPVAEPTVAPPEPEPAAEPAPTIEQQVETNFPTCDAATELKMADSAQAFLTGARPADALALLTEYQRRCPSGRWSDRAWSVRMASLCELHRDQDAVALMQWFSTDYPTRRGALREQLDGACSEDVLRRGLAEPK